jgi:serine protease Do
VQENSPAENAGIKSEDVITKLNGNPIKNSIELRNQIAATSPGKKVRLTIIRNGEEKEVTVILGELPEEASVAQRSEASVEKIGITVANISPSLADRFNLQKLDEGIVVTDVQPGSVAAQSGLRPGDVLLSINRKTVKNVSSYNDLMESVNTGDTVLLYIQRGEGKIFVAFEVP